MSNKEDLLDIIWINRKTVLLNMDFFAASICVLVQAVADVCLYCFCL